MNLQNATEIRSKLGTMKIAQDPSPPARKSNSDRRMRWQVWVGCLLFLLPILYLLSAAPAFYISRWLAECQIIAWETHQAFLEITQIVHAPVLWLAHNSPLEPFLDWWWDVWRHLLGH